MAMDPYTAVWVSHSSMGDFLKCPRAYYLHNMYKDPKTKRKVNIVNPALSLGQAVHEVLEGLASKKAEERFNVDFEKLYEVAWSKISGKRGGFLDAGEEKEMRDRGWEMISRVVKNPGPLKNKALKMKDGDGGMPPNFYLSPDDNIILCGKIDWLEYIPECDGIRVLDFKTGKNEEKEDSLQLPIYSLLLNELQKRKVVGALYWYLFKDDKPIEVKLPNIDDARKRVLEVALKVKNARLNKEFKCPRGEGGCYACRPFEAILKGEAESVGRGEYGTDLYIIKQ